MEARQVFETHHVTTKNDLTEQNWEMESEWLTSLAALAGDEPRHDALLPLLQSLHLRVGAGRALNMHK